jgi:hypothetical protein
MLFVTSIITYAFFWIFSMFSVEEYISLLGPSEYIIQASLGNDVGRDQEAGTMLTMTPKAETNIERYVKKYRDPGHLGCLLRSTRKKPL